MDKRTMVISVMDKDRPGIVAEMAEGISHLGGNLADLRESVLRSYFTMILVATFPAPLSAEQVETELSKNSTSHISVKEAEGELPQIMASDETYVLTATGRDQIARVAQVARFCSDHNANIIDLASNGADDMYTMMLQLDLSEVASLDAFIGELDAFGTSHDLKIVLQHNDIFRATNEI